MVLLAVAAAAVAGIACELIVPDTVPAFACRPGADTCPSGSVCAPATGECVALSKACTPATCGEGTRCDVDGTLTCLAFEASAPDASPDAGDDAGDDGPGEASGAPSDAHEDAPGPCRGLGCRCTGPSDCESGICADQVTATSDIYVAAGRASFCTQPCCTSLQCDPSTVCFATGAGGNYCVPPAWIGRATSLGSMGPGQACSVPSDCRSGLCVGGACVDTCCSAAYSRGECAPGTLCRFGDFPGVDFDAHYAAFCAPAIGAGANGTACRADTDCRGGFCDNVSLVCRDACGSVGECGAGQACAYSIGTPGASAVVAACGPAQGPGAEGTDCQTATDCLSGMCDPNSSPPNRCTDMCFLDADCTFPGWRCRPEIVTILGGAHYSLLVCGS